LAVNKIAPRLLRKRKLLLPQLREQQFILASSRRSGGRSRDGPSINQAHYSCPKYSLPGSLPARVMMKK
jgi:hypothetical protein